MTGRPPPLQSSPDLDAARVAAEIAGEGGDPFAAAVRATHMPMIVSDPRRPDNPVVFANDAFCRLTGYTREEVIGRNCRFLQGPDTDPHALARIRAAVRAVEPLKVDVRNYRKDGAPFWNRLMLAPVRDTRGELAYFVASQVDVTLDHDRLEGLSSHNAALVVELDARLRAQTASEARLRLATQAGRLGVWELDAVTRRLEASPEFVLQFGGDPSGTFGFDDWLAAMHPDERPRMTRLIESALATQGELDVECRVLGEDGAQQWRSLRAQANGAAGASRLVGVSQDVTTRREAELRLAFSEESLRLATEAAEVGSWDLDVASDVLTWSDRTRRMFGISPGAACSMTDFYENLHPDDLAATSAAFASALDPAVRATYDVEYRTIGKEDRLTRWVAAKGRAMFDADGVCVRALGTAIDITARRAAEGRSAFLLELGDRLRGLTAPDAILRAAVGALGRHLGASRVGYGQVQPDDATIVLETGYADGVAPLSGAFPVDGFGAAMIARQRLGLTQACEDVFADRAQDSAVWAAINTRAFVSVPLIREGRFQASLFVNRRDPYAWPLEEVRLIEDVAARIWDALARAQAEAALRHANASLERQVAERTAELYANEARLRAVFDTSYQLQGLLDADGRVIDANSTLLALLRAPIEEVRGQPFWLTPWFATTEGLSETVKAAVSAVAGGESVRLELTAETLLGLRAYDMSLRPVRDKRGRVTGMVPEAIDITERLDAEEQLRQSQKMEAVGQLTGGIAHDFNNLLMGVIGSLEMLQRRVAAGRSDGVERYVAAATTSAQRAAALTQRLLAFARRQPLDPRRVDCNRLIAGMEDLLRRTLGAAITLETREAEGLWPVLCDPNQLESAILNLVINARDAMPDGGGVTISTSNAVIDEAAARARGGGLTPGDYAVLTIADTGEGMTSEVVSKIFDPFFTTKPIGQGTGLGLSMVYGFVRQSNGGVRVVSTPGVGAAFELLLPRIEGRSDPVTETRAELVASPRADPGDTVLVVEDETAVRNLVVETLQSLGYVALEAADGPQGLEILQAGTRIDLLVTDVGLPGLNGRKLADAAREHRPDLKVLFMTGFVHDADVGGGGELETGTEIMTKPFALDVLANRVRGMIARRG